MSASCALFCVYWPAADLAHRTKMNVQFFRCFQAGGGLLAGRVGMSSRYDHYAATLNSSAKCPSILKRET